MSYSKQVHGNISYSKTVSVSYPASESGGSRSETVSGTVPVDIEVYVDTRAFDASVASCNGQICGLTGSVVAMNAAQCAAIKQTGKEVSDHISNGFFTMIKSEISQGMAALFSRINSGIGLILEKTKLVKKQQTVMESDYSRTKARYVKVFSDLDEECRKRVTELDKEAFVIANNVQKEQLSEQESQQASFLLTGMNDGVIVNQQLSTACLRSKVNNLMYRLADNVSEQLKYSNKLNVILHDKKCDKIDSQCIPVVFAEADDYNGQPTKMAHCFVTSAIDGQYAKQITDTMQNYFASQTDVWSAPPKTEMDMLTNAFNTLAEKMLSQSAQDQNGDSKRVYDMIVQLKNQSTIVTNHKQ
jgi:hypothetical protein